MMIYFIELTFFTSVIYLLSKYTEAIETEGLIGGDKVNNDQFNYQVSVQANGLHKCGGGILDDQFIITAAHCMVNVTDGRILNMHYTVVATKNTSSPNQVLASAELKKLYIPKSFNILSFYDDEGFYLKGDLAILKLKDGLGLANNPFLSKLNIRESSFLHLHKTFFISSHGVNAVKNKIYQNATNKVILQLELRDGILRYAQAEVVFNYVCNKLYKRRFRYYHLCARVKQLPEKPRGTCWGDSGSPLVDNNGAIIGIFSFGPDTCIEDEYPGVYTRILPYLRYINNIIKGRKTSQMRVFTVIRNSTSENQFVEI